MYTVYYPMHFCFTIEPLWLFCANAFVEHKVYECLLQLVVESNSDADHCWMQALIQLLPTSFYADF